MLVLVLVLLTLVLVSMVPELRLKLMVLVLPELSLAHYTIASSSVQSGSSARVRTFINRTAFGATLQATGPQFITHYTLCCPWSMCLASEVVWGSKCQLKS